MELCYERLEKEWFVLTEDYHHPLTLRKIWGNDPRLDEYVNLTGLLPDEIFVVTVPKGFVTDLASVPKAAWPLFPPEGKYGAAAAVHDLLYQKKNAGGFYSNTPCGFLSSVCGKTLADRIFLAMMKEYDVDGLTYTLFFKAVDTFGWPSYVDDNSRCSYTRPTVNTYVFSHNYEFFREDVEPAFTADELMKLERVQGNARFPNIKRTFIRR